nr:MAG TPA: hypothetical protein [Caudoviricetes sp.]
MRILIPHYNPSKSYDCQLQEYLQFRLRYHLIPHVFFLYFHISQTISLTYILLPFISYLPFPYLTICTLLIYSLIYFLLDIFSIVVEL